MCAQTDLDFQLLIIASEDMPQIYTDRLEALAASVPIMEILSTPERDIGRALRPMMKSSIETDQTALHFRIDDDDALCASFVARLRAIAEQSNFDAGTAISFPNGVVSFFHNGRAKHAPYLKSYVAAGLAFVAGENHLRNPFQVQHRQVGRRQPSFVDPSFRAFQVTQHMVNNTKGYDRVIHDQNTTSDGVKRLLRNNPNIAAGAVVDPALDAEIDAAFSFSSGAGLRRALERTLDPKELAKEFGFL